MSLFSKIAFKATVGNAPFKYLSVVGHNGSLEYAAEGVLEPGTKFAIENVHGDLVHIRSCSNNKYWVSTLDDGNAKNYSIVAQAVKPVVDQTSPGCTLFKIRVDNNERATFYHVQSGRVVGLRLDHAGHPTTILSIDPTATTQAVSVVVDYDALVLLPKFVAFKDSNGLYLKNDISNGKTKFSGSEVGDPDIVYECQHTADGHLRVRVVNSVSGAQMMFLTVMFPLHWDNPKFLSDPPWIQATPSKENPGNLQQTFDAIKVDKNVIALRSCCTNLILVRDTSGSNTLMSIETGLVKDAHLEIVEPVLSRTVKVYEFDLDMARIYDMELLYSDDHIWDNYTNEAQSGSANGSITTSKSTTYSNNVTVSGDVKTTFESGIPFILEAKIEVSATASYSHQWGDTTTEAQEVGHVFNVAVVPWKTTRARGTASKAKCDVPFAYIQRDYPSDGGPPRITRLQDGVFTGANAYNFRSEVRYEDLPTHSGLASAMATKCIKRIEPHKE